MKSTKFTYYYFLVAAVLGIAVACSGNSAEDVSENDTALVIAEPGEDTTSRALSFFDKDKAMYTSANLAAFKKVSKQGKFVKQFAQSEKGLLFINQSKESFFKSNGEFDNTVRFGLISDKGEQLLPMKYELISHPGMVAANCVEIKKNSKFGLYDYATKQLIDPVYDVLFPSPIMEYVAIGVKGETYYKIYQDGTSKPFTDDQAVISYTQLFATHPFNYESAYFAMYYETLGFEYMNEEDYGDTYLPRVFLPSSYLAQLNVAPVIERDISSMDDSLNVSISKIQKIGNQNTAFVSTLFERVADARGYEYEESHLHILNKANKSIANLLIWDDSQTYEMNGYTDSGRKSKFINDSVLEVKNFVQNENEALPYSQYTRYDFYQISANGKVKKFDRGLFPMTEVIELARYHFKGGFLRFVTDEEELMTNPAYDPEMEGAAMTCSFNHLSAEDLRYMLNEIYARHGMKFKDPKLTAIFKQFPWYKPTSNNVDNALSVVEKKNVTLILRLEKEIKAKPSKFIQRSYSYYVAAG